MAKRRGKWVGDLSVHDLQAGPDVATIIQVVPTVTDESLSDVVLETCHIHLNIERILVTAIDACGYVIWLGKVLVGTTTPAQGLDPLSLVSGAWADADILLQGLLPVPPVNVNGFDGVKQINHSLAHVQLQVKSKRRFNRVNHGIFMAIACDVDNVVRVTTVRRSYLSTSG